MRKKLLIDGRFIDVAKRRWGDEYDIIPSPKVHALSEPVSYHPDLSIIKIEDIYVCEKSVYEYYKKMLPDKNIVCGKTLLSSHYPNDIAYNVLISEKTAMANFKYTDPKVKYELIKRNYKLVNINQGYAACSSASFSGKIISADNSVLKACGDLGIEALKIEAGDVLLKGYDYGFIGGATGFAFGRLFIFGDITKHKNFDSINKFCTKNNVEIEYIKDFPLTDVGTIIGID